MIIWLNGWFLIYRIFLGGDKIRGDLHNDKEFKPKIHNNCYCACVSLSTTAECQNNMVKPIGLQGNIDESTILVEELKTIYEK